MVCVCVGTSALHAHIGSDRCYNMRTTYYEIYSMCVTVHAQLMADGISTAFLKIRTISNWLTQNMPTKQ